MVHPTILPCVVVARIQPQNARVEHSAPLVLFQPQGHPLAVDETDIPNRAVESEDQFRGCDL